MPFIDRSPYRYYGKRVLPISVMAIMVVDIVMLTLIADIPTVLTERLDVHRHCCKRSATWSFRAWAWSCCS